MEKALNEMQKQKFLNSTRKKLNLVKKNYNRFSLG